MATLCFMGNMPNGFMARHASHAMSESHDFCIHVYITDFCIHVYITESFLDILSHRSHLFRIDMYIKQSIRYFYY